MNRRTFVASVMAMPHSLQEAGKQITHVETLRTGEQLKSRVVRGADLSPGGDSPGARARVHFNGPTAQLTALAAGLVTLEPGSRPHPPHRHPEEELMVIGEGSGEIEVAGVVTQVTAGDMMYAEANVLHGIVNTGQVMMTFYFVKMAGRNA